MKVDVSNNEIHLIFTSEESAQIVTEIMNINKKEKAEYDDNVSCPTCENYMKDMKGKHFCTAFNRNIPEKHVPTGCDSWKERHATCVTCAYFSQENKNGDSNMLNMCNKGKQAEIPAKIISIGCEFWEDTDIPFWEDTDIPF